MAAKTVNISEICALLAGDGHEPLTAMAVSTFVKEGMPKSGRGAYDPIACARWYLGRLRTANKARSTEGADGSLQSLDDVEIRLKTAKAVSEEMTIAERRAQTMPLALYESQLTAIVQTVKHRILQVPARLSPRLINLTSAESKALMMATLKDTLSEIATLAPPLPKVDADEPAKPKRKRATKPAAKRAAASRPRTAGKPRARKR